MVFTCSRTRRYLRVACSTRSRTVHPALQGTTTDVSPKVTVTFMSAARAPRYSSPAKQRGAKINKTNKKNKQKQSPEAELLPVGEQRTPVGTGATGVSGPVESRRVYRVSARPGGERTCSVSERGLSSRRTREAEPGRNLCAHTETCSGMTGEGREGGKLHITRRPDRPVLRVGVGMTLRYHHTEL